MFSSKIEAPMVLMITGRPPRWRSGRSDVHLLSQPDEPFAWKPVFVRRSLGLAVVECLCRRAIPHTG